MNLKRTKSREEERPVCIIWSDGSLRLRSGCRCCIVMGRTYGDASLVRSLALLIDLKFPQSGYFSRKYYPVRQPVGDVAGMVTEIMVAGSLICIPWTTSFDGTKSIVKPQFFHTMNVM